MTVNTPSELTFSGFDLVLPDQVIRNGSVRVRDGVISEILDHPLEEANFHGAGRLLMPGFIDMHGDMIEREAEPRPGVRMPFDMALHDLDRKMVGCGVTTAYASVCFHPSASRGHIRHHDTSKALLRALRAQRDGLLIDHRIHARFEITYTEAKSAVLELAREGGLDLVSLMDHTPGQGQNRDIEAFAAKVARNSGAPIDQIRAEFKAEIAERAAKDPEIRANAQEMAALCVAQGITLASHDDDTPEKVAWMHGLGVKISEFPITAEAAQEAQAHGMRTAMGAPNVVRGGSQSGNLSAQAAFEAGALDILAADYHPSALLPALLRLGAGGPDALARAVRLATLHPAETLGLTDRGSLTEGKAADLVIAGHDAPGTATSVYRRGRLVYSDGRISGTPPPAKTG